MSTVCDLMQRASTKRALLQVEATLPPLPDARTVACLVNDQRALSYSKAGDVHSARVLAHYYQHRLPAPHATLPTPLTADVGVDARSTLHTLFAHDAVPMVPGQADTAEARHARVVLAGHVYSVPELKAARTARTLGRAPSTPAQPLEPALLPFNYVYTAPEADTKVKADDLIIVMTSRANPYVCAVKMIQRWYRAITARTTPSSAPGRHTSARSVLYSNDCEERAAVASPLVDAPTAAPASVRAAPPPAPPPVPLHLFPPPRSSPPPAHALHASPIVPANTPPTQEQWVGVASPTFSSAVGMQPMPASTSANQPHTV
ncbi:hypothetical protein EON67_03370 [archaeon]|nr:MAG: hypothetical protein EON67_03370 [archaeon]